MYYSYCTVLNFVASLCRTNHRALKMMLCSSAKRFPNVVLSHVSLQVDCTVDTQLCAEQEVRGYPT